MKYRMDEITESCLGKMLDAQKNTGEYQPYLANINVRWGSFDLENLSLMRFEVHESERYGIKDGDLIMCEGGEPGRCAIWRDEIPNMKIQKALHRIRANKDLVDVEYLYYWFLLSGRNDSLRRYFTETTIKHLPGETLKQLEIDLPDMQSQKSISKVLGVIDKKIALNNKINDNLEQMAYDTYMHLFFKKQPNGKLGEIIEENNKSSVQVGEAKGESGSYPFFTSGDAILEWNDSMIDGRNCFLNTGGNAGVKFYIGEAAYSTDTWCITANRNLADYLYLLLLSIKPELNQKFFQGTGLKHLQKPLLKDRMIYIPTEQEVKDFNSAVQPLMDMISANTRENKRLISLRDWLLPMLMNGQASVED